MPEKCQSMSRRQRFAATMQHQTLDRPLVDIGATSLTAMSAGCQRVLRQALGFTGEPRPCGGGGVDERILEWAGTDFRSVGYIVDLPSPTQTRASSATPKTWTVGAFTATRNSQR